MEKPVINSFHSLAPLLVHKYERYLPTSYDGSMTILEKVNKVIIHLNQIGELTNDVVEQWNNVMKWVMEDGLVESVVAKLDSMVLDGSFDKIINETLFNELNEDINNVSNDLNKLSSNVAENILNLNNGLNNKIDKESMFVNAIDFGYIGDGIKDDTESIQNAINAGSKVYVPKGTPLITSQLVVGSDTVIFGDGKWSTVFQAKGDFILFNLKNEEAKTGVKIHDIGMVNVGGSEQGVAFDLNYFTNGSSIENVRIENFRIGIQMEKTWYASFTDIFIRLCTIGIKLNSPSSTQQVNAIKFDSCFIQRCSNAFVADGSNVSVGIKFESCTFERSLKTGVKINRYSPVTFDNCYFEQNYQHAKSSDTLKWETPIDIYINLTGSRNVVTLIGCYFARANDFLNSSEKTSIYLGGSTKLSVDGIIFTCNSSGYINSDIYSDSTEIPTLVNVSRDGQSVSMYTGKVSYDVIGFLDNANLRYSNTSKMVFMSPKHKRYYVKFIPSETVSVSVQPVLQLRDVVEGVSLGSALLGTSFTENSPIEKTLGIVESGKVISIQVSTGSDVDVKGTIIVYSIEQS